MHWGVLVVIVIIAVWLTWRYLPQSYRNQLLIGADLFGSPLPSAGTWTTCDYEPTAQRMLCIHENGAAGTYAHMRLLMPGGPMSTTIYRLGHEIAATTTMTHTRMWVVRAQLESASRTYWYAMHASDHSNGRIIAISRAQYDEAITSGRVGADVDSLSFYDKFAQ